jgi:hypothetical protein
MDEMNQLVDVCNALVTKLDLELPDAIPYQTAMAIYVGAVMRLTRAAEHLKANPEAFGQENEDDEEKEVSQ